jgi:phage tail-like protein
MMSKLDVAYYPATGFHFNVRFGKISKPDANGPTEVSKVDIDSRWSEVSGLNVEMTTEELIEGGENRFVHKLPQRTKFPNLVLKRGVFTSLSSDLIKWAENAIFHFDIKPCEVHVMLLDEKHEPVLSWVFANAYPVKLSIGDLKATDNSVLIESLELNYQFFQKKKEKA